MINYNSELQNNNIDLQEILDTINALPEAGGVELPTLTAPASEAEVFEGYEYIDQEGAAKVGSFTIESELSTQNDLIAQIQSAVDSLPEGGNSPIETCTVQIEQDAPGLAYFIVHYIDTNFVPQILDDYGSFEIPKNTIISIESWSSMVDTPEGAAQLFYGMGFTAYQITNNVTFIFRG